MPGALQHVGERFVPAAGRRWLTVLYDPVIAATMRERRFRRLVAQRVLAARPRRVVDVGCGTGTLALELVRRAPTLQLTGVDADPDILRRARAKLAPAGAPVELVHGRAEALPLEDGTVDCVVSSLLLHHLAPEGKALALAEMRRVLRPEGRLVIADWGRPQDPLMRIAFLTVQLLDGFAGTQPHVAGELPHIVVRAGFTVLGIEPLRTGLGTLELLVARPSAPAVVGDPAPDASEQARG
ncbi:MAG TPA: class I SAM-dependent methyltransferase [Solirubrobacteraceae bacterium]|nr:class I SAM-dependent methyltransferase [Solirubrobacteraceae bacterium]